MADDGMLLNFSVPSDITTKVNTPKFKGGSWRERMRLKKNAKTRSEGGTLDKQQSQGVDQAYNRATRGGNPNYTPKSEEQRPVKRRRENGEFIPSLKQTTERPAAGSENSVKKPLGSREVISSLFSFNPTPQTIEQQPMGEADQAPAKPSNAPLPDGIDTFTSLGLSTKVAAHLLTKMALKTPTAIQKTAVSQLLKEDSDVFIQSQTGSGKTLAYLLPIVQRIMRMSEVEQASDTVRNTALSRDSGLFAIILAPTRELCKQILLVLEKLLGCAHYIVAGIVQGGENRKSEKARLRKGVNILVATPGRLVDHLEHTETLDVSKVRFLVLDEGDRLMDLGFEEEISQIVRTLDSKKRRITRPGLPENRLTMLCSATLKMTVQKLGDISLKDAILIKGESDDTSTDTSDAEREDSAFLAPAQLKQSYIVAAAKLRLVTLTALLRQTFARRGTVMKAIVFVSCADSVEFHFKTLTRSSKDATAEEVSDTEKESLTPIPEALQDAVSPSPMLSSSANSLTLYKLHGSLPQASRTAIIKAFANTTAPSLLIATDVAARGLDLPNLDLVVEYDPAFSTDDHLHRIGRTARLGRDGRAVIFLLPGKEEGYVDVLKKSYKIDVSGISNVTSTSADEIMRKGFSPTTGVVSSKSVWEAKATDFQLDVERWVLGDPTIKELAKKAFQSQIRAYATHIASERKWFNIKDLHLGHLAKSFGLRDPPGKVNVAGAGRKGSSNARPQANEGKKRKVDATDEVKVPAQAGIDATVDAEEAAKRMRSLVRDRKKMMGAGADEFNLA